MSRRLHKDDNGYNNCYETSKGSYNSHNGRRQLFPQQVDLYNVQQFNSSNSWNKPMSNGWGPGGYSNGYLRPTSNLKPMCKHVNDGQT